MRLFRQNRIDGFTLIETLFVMALTGCVCTLAYNVLNGGSRTYLKWKGNTEEIVRFERVKCALRVLAKECDVIAENAKGHICFMRDTMITQLVIHEKAVLIKGIINDSIPITISRIEKKYYENSGSPLHFIVAVKLCLAADADRSQVEVTKMPDCSTILKKCKGVEWVQ